MSENKKQLLDRLAKSVDQLNELESEKLVSFGEGMAFGKNCAKQTRTDEIDNGGGEIECK